MNEKEPFGVKKFCGEAAIGGYLPFSESGEQAVGFAGANNGRKVEGGKDTIEWGWSVWNLKSGSSFTISHEEIFTDPLAWQAVFKARDERLKEAITATITDAMEEDHKCDGGCGICQWAESVRESILEPVINLFDNHD